jgi:hypothetical protein
MDEWIATGKQDNQRAKKRDMGQKGHMFERKECSIVLID